MPMQFFGNKTTVTASEQTFNDRAYLTSPVTMLSVGVLNGIYVPAEEASKFVEAWNGRPVTLNHPQRNGQYVSANTPEIAAHETPGMVWNSLFKSNQLRAEIWIDTEKAGAIGGDAVAVMERMRKGEPVEVSTGYFADVEEAAGTYNGKSYSGIARNIRPDHLALLPNGVGACSWQDGCGTPRVNSASACGCAQKGGNVGKDKPVDNEQEMGDRYTTIRRAFRDTQDRGQDGMIEFDNVSVFENYVIAQSYKTKAWAAYSYIQAGENVTFGEPVPVDVIYRSKADGAELVTVNRARQAADQSFISEVVSGLLSALGRGKHQTVSANAEEEDKMEKEKEGLTVAEVVPVANSDKASGDNAVLVNLAALVEGLSKKVDAMGAQLTANADKERLDLVAGLSVNERCPFDETELKVLSVAHLQKLATAYQPADYSGGVGVVANRGGEVFETLAMPAWAVAGKEK